MEIRVLIADDHAMIREGLKRLLEFEGLIKVVAEASNGEECIEMLKSTEVDVLLLDINMSKLNGLEVLQILRNEKMGTKVLMLTVHNEVDYLVKAVEIGVEGYILKDSESSELINAIECINRGEVYIQPHLIPLLNHYLVTRNGEKSKVDMLTNRELEVLLKIAEGMFNKQIADVMNISERTVKNHISNIFKKIEVADRTQAAVFAIKNDLIKLY